MQNIINSTISTSDIRKAAAEGWTPSNVLGAIRLVTERETLKLKASVDFWEYLVHKVFRDKAQIMMNAMPYGVDADISKEDWELLCCWYNVAMDRYTYTVSDYKIAEVLHIEVSPTLTKIADVIRKEWEVFGLDKI